MTTKRFGHEGEYVETLIHELHGETAMLVDFAIGLSESVRELTPHAPAEVLRTVSKDLRDSVLDLTVTLFSVFSKADRLALLSELEIERDRRAAPRNRPTH